MKICREFDKEGIKVVWQMSMTRVRMKINVLKKIKLRQFFD